MPYKKLTREWCLKNSTLESFELLTKYHKMIEEGNKKINLTGFTGDRLWKEGIYESLILMSSAFDGKPGKLLDIGSGVGFPSVPYKIAFPHIQLVIIEPLKKRINFLEKVSEELALDIEFVVGRVETTPSVQADFITARAVAPIGVLIEISFQHGKKGAFFSFPKGPSIAKEIEDAEFIIEAFRLDAESFEITDKNIDRENYLYQYFKNVDTLPGYPRPWAKIIKNYKN